MIFVLDNQNVREVDAGASNANDDLAGTRLGGGDFFHNQTLGGTVFLAKDCFHGLFLNQGSSPRPRAKRSLRERLVDFPRLVPPEAQR